LYDWVESGKRIPIIGSGKNKYQLLEVGDLVDAVYMTLTKPDEIVNDTFNVGAEDFATVAEDVGSLCSYARKGARVMPTPEHIVVPLLRMAEKLNISPLYEWIYATAGKDSYVDISKIKKRLGWKPQFSNVQALTRSYQWYLDHKKELTQTGITHRSKWDQGVLGFLKKML